MNSQFEKYEIRIFFLAVFLTVATTPAYANEFLAPDANAIEYLWQGRITKSPEIRSAVLSVVDVPTSKRNAISQHKVLPYLGSGWSNQDPFHGLTDFPEVVYGGGVLTKRQAAYVQYTPLLRREAQKMVSDWHKYEIEYLRANRAGTESKELEALRAKLVSLCGNKSVKLAEKSTISYTPAEVSLIVKSKERFFPQGH